MHACSKRSFWMTFLLQVYIYRWKTPTDSYFSRPFSCLCYLFQSKVLLVPLCWRCTLENVQRLAENLQIDQTFIRNICACVIVQKFKNEHPYSNVVRAGQDQRIQSGFAVEDRLAEGRTCKEVASNPGVDAYTVSRTVSRFRETGGVQKIYACAKLTFRHGRVTCIASFPQTAVLLSASAMSAWCVWDYKYRLLGVRFVHASHTHWIPWIFQCQLTN